MARLARVLDFVAIKIVRDEIVDSELADLGSLLIAASVQQYGLEAASMSIRVRVLRTWTQQRQVGRLAQ